MTLTLRIAAGIAACVLGAAAAVAAPAYNKLYAFGDSYSDIGAGYLDGNGPTAVAYLAQKMGLPVAHSKDSTAAGKSIVFAVTGAESGRGEGEKIETVTVSIGLINQIEDFECARQARRAQVRCRADAVLRGHRAERREDSHGNHRAERDPGAHHAEGRGRPPRYARAAADEDSGLRRRRQAPERRIRAAAVASVKGPGDRRHTESLGPILRRDHRYACEVRHHGYEECLLRPRPVRRGRHALQDPGQLLLLPQQPSLHCRSQEGGGHALPRDHGRAHGRHDAGEDELIRWRSASRRRCRPMADTESCAALAPEAFPESQSAGLCLPRKASTQNECLRCVSCTSSIERWTLQESHFDQALVARRIIARSRKEGTKMRHT